MGPSLSDQTNIFLVTVKYLWEKGKVLHHTGTLLEEDADGQEGHAGSQVLEGQVEATAPGQRAKAAHLGVHLHQPPPEVHLREALVRRNGVHLGRG